MKYLQIIGFVVLVGCGSSNNDTSLLDEPITALGEGNNSIEQTDEAIPVEQPDEAIPVEQPDDFADFITDRTWILAAVDGGTGIETAVTQDPGFEFTVLFESDSIELDDLQGQVVTPIQGTNVCNAFTAGYSLEGNVLNLLVGTEDTANCERSSDETSQLFNNILFSFNNPSMLSIDDGLLTIASGANEKLIFTENSSVEFTELLFGDLASQCNSTFSQPLFQIFRDQQSLNNLYESFVQLPCALEGPPQINFDNFTALFVAQEITGSGGFDIEIVSATIKSGRLMVGIQKTAPGENCLVTDAPSGPYRIYSVAGVYENVDFIERPTVSPPCN